MNFGEKTKRRVSINITSLVDILIVLLLFFMLTTQFIHMETLHLSLSGDEDTSRPIASNFAIIVTLTGKGNFVLNGKEFNLLQLKDKIKPLLGNEGEKDVVIVSKKIASVQDVVTAIDYIKAVGGKNISLAEDK